MGAPVNRAPRCVVRVRRLVAVGALGSFLALGVVRVAHAEGGYRWRDDAGSVHVAETLDAVPDRYRARAAEARREEDVRAAARQALEASGGTPSGEADTAAGETAPIDSASAWAALAGFAAPRASSPASVRPSDPCGRAREQVARWQLGPEWGGGADRASLAEAARLCPGDERIRVLANLSGPDSRPVEPPRPEPVAPKPAPPRESVPVRAASLTKPRAKPAANADLPGIAEGFASSQTAHFDFRWAEETRDARDHGDNQEKVEEYLEDAYREVGQWLDAYPSRRIPVVFYAHGDFKKRFPGTSWAWGFWDGSAIRVNSTLKSAQVIRDELYHEYTHVLVSELTGRSRPPAWLNEGLAELVEHRAQFGTSRAVDPPSTLVRNVAAQSKARIHGPLSGAFSSGGGCGARRRAYARAYLAVVYLQDEKGMDGVLRIFRELERGKPFDDAMSLVYPQGMPAFEKDFDRWLQDQAH